MNFGLDSGDHVQSFIFALARPTVGDKSVLTGNAADYYNTNF